MTDLENKTDSIKTTKQVLVQVVNVSYSLSKGKKLLLKDVHLEVEPGDMVALMGPSGAGKSTLLDVIANRKIRGEISGYILINGKPWTHNFHRETAYCLQDDVHFPELTVEETLQYAVWTRMSDRISKQERSKRVDYLIDMMNLNHVRHSFVGDSSSKGISGGQMKRLSIAVEIAALPSLVFLDEPTSGLDSTISFEVMTAVRKMSDEGKTIISTIHQPSNKTFSLFNKVAFLVGGRIAYFGLISKVLDYFSNPEIGFQLPAEYKASNENEDDAITNNNMNSMVPGSKYFNISEFVINICSGKLTGQIDTKDLPEAYLKNDIFKVLKSHLYNAVIISKSDSNKDNRRSSTTHTSLWTQFSMCFSRCWKVSLRDKRLLFYLVFGNLAIGLLIGITFVGQGKSPPEPLFPEGFITTSALNFTTLLFSIIFYPYILSQTILHSLTYKMVLYERELKAGAYQTSSLWLAEMLVPIPQIFLLNWIYFIPVYFITGLPVTADSIFFLFFQIYFVRLTSYYVICFVVAWFKDEGIAHAFYFLVVVFLEYLFSGVAILFSTLPTFWTFAPYIAYLRYSMEGCMKFYFSDYPTDDDLNYSTGNGNILSFYGFTLPLTAGMTFLVLTGFMIGHALLTLYFMFPTRSKIKVISTEQDLNENNVIINSNVVQPTSPPSTLSASRQSLRMTTSMYITETATKEIKRTRSSLRLMRLHSVRSSLQKSSLDIRRIEDEEEEEDEKIDQVEIIQASSHSPPPQLNVAFYKQNSINIRRARGCKLSFQNIQYEVSGITILRGVSGVVKPGEMCALLGASGAGKSTLLDILAGRKNTGTIQGDIYFNGKSRSNQVMKSSAYVMQDNVHYAQLSVRETLYFSAELRLDENMSRSEKADRVQQILNMLGLTHVSDTLVGNCSIRGISGGQLKRLSIGVEIVHLPDIIYLDEPTTGLDGTTALEVMSAVRNLADQNRTVLFTIHSPTVEIGRLFDKLLLLQSGKIAYFGPAKEAHNYFLQSSFELPVTFSETKNPFESYISIISINNLKIKANSEFAIVTESLEKNTDISSVTISQTDHSNSVANNVTTLHDYYNSTKFSKELQDSIHESKNCNLDEINPNQNVEMFKDITPTDATQTSVYISTSNYNSCVNSNNNVMPADASEQLYITSTAHQVKIVLYRSFILWTKIKVTLISYFFIPFFLAILYGWVYFDAGSPSIFTEQEISYNFVFLLWVAPNTIYWMQQIWVADIINSRIIFYRERGASAVSLFAYWVSCWMAISLYLILCLFIYSVIIFFMTSMGGDTEVRGNIFGWFTLVNILVGLVSFYAMFCISVISHNVEVAHTLICLFLTFSDMYGGLMIVISALPNWLYYWAAQIDFARWSFQALMLNEFLQNPNLISSGQSTIVSFGFNTYTKEECVGILAGLTIGYLLLSYLLMNFIDYEKR